MTSKSNLARLGYQISAIVTQLPPPRPNSSWRLGRFLITTSSTSDTTNLPPAESSKQRRCFAAAATDPRSKKTNSDDDSSAKLSYFERKAETKVRRTEAYRLGLERDARMKSRRDNSPKDALKNEFRSWWVGRKAYEEILDRKSRQAGLEWTIRVATIVERLPIVLPDKDDFEKEFERSQAYLMAHRGKDYPKEFTGITANGNDLPGAYTDEELIALLPENFKLAPRETKADEDGTVSTIERRLKDRVYLLIDDSFPTTEVNLSGGGSSTSANGENDADVVDGGAKNDDGCESLLEAALRGLKERVALGDTTKDGSNSNGSKRKSKKNTSNKKFPLELYCPSQAPLAVRLDAYDTDQQEKTGRFGTKTFFMKVQYDDGTLPPGDHIAWLDRTEIINRFTSSSKECEAKFYRYIL